MFDFILCLRWGGKKGRKTEQNPISLVLKQLGVINLQELPTDKNSSPILPLVVYLEEQENIYIHICIHIGVYGCIENVIYTYTEYKV